ncbi:MAG: sporulation integral membrane protein YtvI [Clostridiales bacterium]|nr:sporulation integral membrane protein YtvI [Clostridiales bacterium]
MDKDENKTMKGEQEISTRHLMGRIGLRIMIIISVAVFILLLGPILHYTMPFILALLMARYILVPLIRKLSGRAEHMKKFWAVIIVLAIMVLVFGVISLALYYLAAEIANLVKNRNIYSVKIDGALTDICTFISTHTDFSFKQVSNTVFGIYEKIVEWAQQELPGRTPSIINKFTKYAPSIGSGFMGFLFFLMASYFVCSDYDNISNKIKSMIPDGVRPYFKQVRAAAGDATFGYLKAQLILSAIITLICTTVLLIIGQSYAILIALVIAIVDFIPMLGSGLVIGPWALLTIVMGDYPKAIVLLALAIGLFLFRRIVEPKVVGDQTGLHPLLSLMSLYIGIKSGGLLGLVIAPIICMMILGLYNSGFFTPTINDIKLISYRLAKYTGMIK